MDANQTMNHDFKIPPISKKHLTPPDEIAKRLQVLIGKDFPLTRKSRTDGSRIRKLVASVLDEYDLPAPSNSYSVIPEKGKGIPKITREYVDTYILTTGSSYNLQVWNRIPTSNALQIEYEDGTGLCANDVRFVLVRVNPVSEKIVSVLVLTPDYIVRHFGKFGAPTIKHQIILSNTRRKEIVGLEYPILFGTDTNTVKALCSEKYIPPSRPFNSLPIKKGEVLPLEIILEKVAKPLIGRNIDGAETKNRGQSLEQIILEELGYVLDDINLLEGQYPDIKNQLLEVKIQDSPTIDLGKYSPEEDTIIFPRLGITAKDVRYIIVLMNPNTNLVEGVILMAGRDLGKHLSYVDGISGKCQRSIKMRLLDPYKGKSLFNPED